METQKYDGAIYVTIDSKACDAVVKKAVTENLPVVGSNSPCDSTAEFPISVRTTCRPPRCGDRCYRPHPGRRRRGGA